jgi:hypothetical protein
MARGAADGMASRVALMVAVTVKGPSAAVTSLSAAGLWPLGLFDAHLSSTSPPSELWLAPVLGGSRSDPSQANCSGKPS